MYGDRQAIDPSGAFLVSATASELLLHDIDQGGTRRIVLGTEPPQAHFVALGGIRVLYSRFNREAGKRELRLIDLSSGVDHLIEPEFTNTSYVYMSHDGRVVVYYDHNVQMYKRWADGNRTIFELPYPNGTALSPDGSKFLFAQSGITYLIDFTAPSEPFFFHNSLGYPRFSDDGRSVIGQRNSSVLVIRVD